MKISESKYRANKKYNAKTYDRIEFNVLKGNRDIIKIFCADNETSINALMNKLLAEHLSENGVELITRSNEDKREERIPDKAITFKKIDLHSMYGNDLIAPKLRKALIDLESEKSIYFEKCETKSMVEQNISDIKHIITRALQTSYFECIEDMQRLADLIEKVDRAFFKACDYFSKGRYSPFGKIESILISFVDRVS